MVRSVRSVPLTTGPLIRAEIVNVSFFFFNVIGRTENLYNLVIEVALQSQI